MRRRRPRAWMGLMFLAILLAGATTLILRGYLLRLAAQAQAGGPGRPVVVAAVDLPRGTRLTPEALETEELPGAYVPPGAVASADATWGRVLAADVLAGEVITTARLAPAGGPVASLVPEGLRAVPIVSSLPGGSVATGDHVDVMATFATGRPYTETVVEAAEIMAVLGDGPDRGETLILLVSPAVAERLAYARAFADLAVAVAPAT